MVAQVSQSTPLTHYFILIMKTFVIPTLGLALAVLFSLLISWVNLMISSTKKGLSHWMGYTTAIGMRLFTFFIAMIFTAGSGELFPEYCSAITEACIVFFFAMVFFMVIDVLASLRRISSLEEGKS